MRLRLRGSRLTDNKAFRSQDNLKEEGETMKRIKMHKLAVLGMMFVMACGGQAGDILDQSDPAAQSTTGKTDDLDRELQSAIGTYYFDSQTNQHKLLVHMFANQYHELELIGDKVDQLVNNREYYVEYLPVGSNPNKAELVNARETTQLAGRVVKIFEDHVVFESDHEYHLKGKLSRTLELGNYLLTAVLVNPEAPLPGPNGILELEVVKATRVPEYSCRMFDNGTMLSIVAEFEFRDESLKAGVYFIANDKLPIAFGDCDLVDGEYHCEVKQIRDEPYGTMTFAKPAEGVTSFEFMMKQGVSGNQVERQFKCKVFSPRIIH